MLGEAIGHCAKLLVLALAVAGALAGKWGVPLTHTLMVFFAIAAGLQVLTAHDDLPRASASPAAAFPFHRVELAWKIAMVLASFLVDRTGSSIFESTR